MPRNFFIQVNRHGAQVGGQLPYRRNIRRFFEQTKFDPAITHIDGNQELLPRPDLRGFLQRHTCIFLA